MKWSEVAENWESKKFSWRNASGTWSSTQMEPLAPDLKALWPFSLVLTLKRLVVCCSIG